jgi:hypothetical protein
MMCMGARIEKECAWVHEIELWARLTFSNFSLASFIRSVPFKASLMLLIACLSFATAESGANVSFNICIILLSDDGDDGKRQRGNMVTHTHTYTHIHTRYLWPL